MHKSLRYLLSPSSIAVVGASESVFYSRDLIINLQRHGYKGTIYPVNPRRDRILGLRCYPSLASIPDPIDLVIVAIGREKIPELLHDCTKRQVKAMLVLTTGFAESDQLGGKLQESLSETSLKTGMRICGPNCVGFYNLIDRVVASPLPTKDDSRPMEAGNIAIISQSGGLGLGTLFQYGYDHGINFSYAITTGNEADLSVSDFLSYMINDANTDSIAILIEGLVKSSEFLSNLELALKARKPVVVMKMANTKSGNQAALSHTGKIAGSAELFSAVLKQKGAIEADEFEELVETADLLAKVKLPKGDRVLVVSGSGGLATYLSDLFDEAGLPLTNLDGTLYQQELSKIESLLSFGRLRNPADVRGAGLLAIKDVLRGALSGDEFDIIVVACEVCGVDGFGAKLAEDLIELSRDSQKPIIALWTGGRRTEGHASYLSLEKSSVPLFRNSRRCVKAIRSLITYSKIVRNLTS